jgi:hypothetical protein
MFCTPAPVAEALTSKPRPLSATSMDSRPLRSPSRTITRALGPAVERRLNPARETVVVPFVVGMMLAGLEAFCNASMQQK